MSRATTTTRALLAPWLAAPLVAGACGGEPAADPRAGEVVRTIRDFATADGAQACQLLTQDALDRIYDDLEGCIERSDEFERGEVKVESVLIGERGTRATAEARSLRGTDRFTVVARFVSPPGCPVPCPQGQWRISKVTPAR